MKDIDNTKQKNWFTLLLIILAGEAVFILPFVLARVFRPTVLDVFNVTNLEWGTCTSVYGITALFAYVFGGPLADRFPPRKLIAVALVLTALGGVYFATYPSTLGLKILYGYWGVTTIFLFWAAMIKATRVWGGITSQGKAFGFLDGGRGLVGALFASLGVLIFSLFITGEISDALLVDRKLAFNQVILVCSAIVAGIGVLVWFFLKQSTSEEIELPKISAKHIRAVLKIPSVWLLMIIILCAYVGYKTTDIFSQYAEEVMLYDEIHSAKIGTFLLFIRPVVGVIIGFLADRSKTTLWLVISFVISIVGSLLFASDILTPDTASLFIVSVFITATGVYAARSLYFATMQEGKIPLVLTGTAVGLISLVGYTPDIFAGPAIGYLLDGSPGKTGHQHVFIMLTVFSAIGLFASIVYYINVKRK